MSFAILASAFTLGLLGATHCATMCGGIVAASTVGKRRLAQAARFGRGALVAAQNAGRIASYAAAGFVAGGVGELAGRTLADHARGVAQIAAAAALLVAGLGLAGILPARATLDRLGVPLWRHVQPAARRFLPIETPGRALAFGALWGFVPCGLVYSALSLSIVAGNAGSGALVMLAFGLGTAPAMIAMGAIAETVVALARRASIRRAAGVLVACFGIVQLVLAVRALTPSRHACCHRVAAASVQPR